MAGTVSWPESSMAPQESNILVLQPSAEENDSSLIYSSDEEEWTQADLAVSLLVSRRRTLARAPFLHRDRFFCHGR